MPSKNRRMMLTLTPELAAAFDEFREATGTAPASFVAHLLVDSIPVIKAVSDGARRVASGQVDALDQMQKVLSLVMHQGTAAQLELLEHQGTLRKARTDKPGKGVKRSKKAAGND